MSKMLTPTSGQLRRATQTYNTMSKTAPNTSLPMSPYRKTTTPTWHLPTSPTNEALMATSRAQLAQLSMLMSRLPDHLRTPAPLPVVCQSVSAPAHIPFARDLGTSTSGPSPRPFFPPDHPWFAFREDLSSPMTIVVNTVLPSEGGDPSPDSQSAPPSPTFSATNLATPFVQPFVPLSPIPSSNSTSSYAWSASLIPKFRLLT
jgi:hypothetical protein